MLLVSVEEACGMSNGQTGGESEDMYESFGIDGTEKGVDDQVGS